MPICLQFSPPAVSACILSSFYAIHLHAVLILLLYPPACSPSPAVSTCLQSSSCCPRTVSAAAQRHPGRQGLGVPDVARSKVGVKGAPHTAGVASRNSLSPSSSCIRPERCCFVASPLYRERLFYLPLKASLTHPLSYSLPLTLSSLSRSSLPLYVHLSLLLSSPSTLFHALLPSLLPLCLTPLAPQPLSPRQSLGLTPLHISLDHLFISLSLFVPSYRGSVISLSLASFTSFYLSLSLCLLLLSPLPSSLSLSTSHLSPSLPTLSSPSLSHLPSSSPSPSVFSPSHFSSPFSPPPILSPLLPSFVSASLSSIPSLHSLTPSLLLSSPLPSPLNRSYPTRLLSFRLVITALLVILALTSRSPLSYLLPLFSLSSLSPFFFYSLHFSPASLSSSSLSLLSNSLLLFHSPFLYSASSHLAPRVLGFTPSLSPLLSLIRSSPSLRLPLSRPSLSSSSLSLAPDSRLLISQPTSPSSLLSLSRPLRSSSLVSPHLVGLCPLVSFLPDLSSPLSLLSSLNTTSSPLPLLSSCSPLLLPRSPSPSLLLSPLSYLISSSLGQSSSITHSISPPLISVVSLLLSSLFSLPPNLTSPPYLILLSPFPCSSILFPPIFMQLASVFSLSSPWLSPRVHAREQHSRKRNIS
ncbi:hypothetical protein C7M84_008722 [Penaeus vannamei]|uniref:Uncharacterized protein n=1 Tax=Penaeus vannamei TaxID=6689 RepID=A0A423T8T3_PENVA|nr:hypothetical protein C7M84_008722 [Penaeus vannamei]